MADPPETMYRGTIVYFGAGALPSFEIPARERWHVVLVEADPKLAARLRQEYEDNPDVVVLHGTVGKPGGTATLHRYNLPELNSLRPPTGILQLYPGLRVDERAAVPTHALAAIIEPLEGDENQLLLDLPGEEHSVLFELKEADLLRRFERIGLEAGEHSLYEEARPGKDAIAILKEAGFDIYPKEPQSDPDRPRYVANFNTGKHECARLKGELDRIQIAVGDRDHRIEALESRLEKALAEVEALKQASGRLEREVEDREAKLRIQQGDLEDLRARYETLQDELLAARAFATSVATTVRRYRDRLAEPFAGDAISDKGPSPASGSTPD